MLYTSGTTGRPKGVMLTHDNIVLSAQNGNKFDSFTPDDTLLAYLPMAWVGDHIFSYGQAFAGAMCVACPESPETIIEDRREIAPTYFFAPAARVREPAHPDHGAHGGRRPTQEGHVRLLPEGGAPATARRSSTASRWASGQRLLYWLGDLCVYAPLRNRMGFSRIRVAYTAGEAIGPELFRFYRALGVNLKQLYGQTEASVYVTLQPDGEVYPDTVGKPGPDVEITNRRHRRGALQEPRRLPEVLQERRGDGGDQDPRRVGAHGRRRLPRPARAPQDHRPRQGRGPAQQRRAVRAEVPREQD